MYRTFIQQQTILASWRFPLTLLALFALFACTCCVAQETETTENIAADSVARLSGTWTAELEIPADETKRAVPGTTVVAPTIFFGLELAEANDAWTGVVINGVERIDIPVVSFDGETGTLEFPHYDSAIAFEFDAATESLKGAWRKRRGPDEVIEMSFRAARMKPIEPSTHAAKFAGRWDVKFESSEDLAVGIFACAAETGRASGTFLTTTGDYRYLDGFATGPRNESADSDNAGVNNENCLVLSCFDGAHAFRFEAVMTDPDALVGDFWSSNTWHETWQGTRNENARLADAFAETSVADASGLDQLSFPDLDGNPTRLNDPAFAGKARIIYVFGSWCPNCHDAAEYLVELDAKYSERGLSILGLAFELTGDQQRDAEQVRRYLERHGADYPVLIAGLADKAKATELFPVLDRVRSYPTTIFIDRTGNVRGIHTGFTGPATGAAYEELKQKFEALIEAMLNEG